MTPHLAPALPAAFTPRPLLPRNTARQLHQQLRGHGITGMYAFALPQLAVVSLPTLTIWITSHTLTWTQGILKITWPAADATGAADHLAQLAKRPSGLQPAPCPGPGGERVNNHDSRTGAWPTVSCPGSTAATEATAGPTSSARSKASPVPATATIPARHGRCPPS
jgi:hypothetical protein